MAWNVEFTSPYKLVEHVEIVGPHIWPGKIMSAVPSLARFRKTVDLIKHERDSVLIKTYYLTASRASELVTKCTAYDLTNSQSRPYGSELEWSLEDYAIPGLKEAKSEKVLLLKIRVAKRKKEVYKSIALPCDPRFEPWTLDLLRYIRDHGTLSFDLTRHSVKRILKERLRVFLANSSRRILNPLRHYRLTHLVAVYGFDDVDLIIYAGWTYGGAKAGAGSAMLDTYLHLDWRKYYGKLLKPMNLA